MNDSADRARYAVAMPEASVDSSFEYCVLGSGSRGNATVLRWRDVPTELETGECVSRDRCVLIDAGLSPRETSRRLQRIGLSLDDIESVLLTHLDGDHFHAGWPKALSHRPIAVHLHERHRYRAKANGLPKSRIRLFDERPFTLLPQVEVRSMLLAHDDEGVVGFRISHTCSMTQPSSSDAALKPTTLGFATDLGRVTDQLIDFLLGVDVLAIESNYDREMQLASNRPLMLKRRIMGGRGHLSNDESLDAVKAIRAHRELGGITLLHLSQQCNDPRLVQRLYESTAPELIERLTITTQDAPAGWRRIVARDRAAAATPGVQLRMF